MTGAVATAALLGVAGAAPAARAHPAPAADTLPADTAVFAGGCFWCMEPPFDALDGVLETVSGYAGGHLEDPTYEEVSAGGTGHREVVRVTYDPARVTYEELLDVFWHEVDPLDAGGQFCDRGFQYSTAIYVTGPEQMEAAASSLSRVEEHLGRGVETEVVSEWAFYPAEAYHQDYYRKNPVRYRFYRWNCGRDARLEEVWGEDAGGH